MKIELTREEMIELINSVDGDLQDTILDQILSDDDLWLLARDAEKASDAIYGIVDALDDLEEAYDRVSSKTGLV